MHQKNACLGACLAAPKKAFFGAPGKHEVKVPNRRIRCSPRQDICVNIEKKSYLCVMSRKNKSAKGNIDPKITGAITPTQMSNCVFQMIRLVSYKPDGSSAKASSHQFPNTLVLP